MKCLNKSCVFSKSMDQVYPRLCLECRQPEDVPHDNSKIIEIKTHFVPLLESRVQNFSLIRHEKSCINVYDKNVMGCQATGADFMLTFGSTIDVLGGNNRILLSEGPKHVDVFITESQARGLLKQLKEKLEVIDEKGN